MFAYVPVAAIAPAPTSPAIALDAAAIDALTAQFTANKNQADQLLLNVVSSEAFRFVAPNKG